MMLKRFISQARLASDVLYSGGEPPRLEATGDVLTALAMPPHVQHDFVAAPLHDQLQLLKPYLDHHYAQQKHAKAQSAAMTADTLARELQSGTEAIPDGIRLPTKLLTMLSTVPAFLALRLIAGKTTWSFPRAELAQVLRSLNGCTDAKVRLRDQHLIVSYTNATSGRGEFVLFDLGQRAGYKGLLTVNLAPQPATAMVDRPIQAPQPFVLPSRLQPANSDANWLMDVVYAVADQLLAG